jgi:hypothetical protein
MRGVERAHAPTWRAVRRAGMVRTAGAFLRVWAQIAGIWLGRAARGRSARRRGHDGDGEGRTMTTSGPGIAGRIRAEVAGWPGVTVEPHRFGGIEFRLGKRELGHLHGDYLADLPFPVRVRQQLVAEGRALPHHVLPQSGWVSYPIRDEGAVDGAIALFRLAYERATARRGADRDD